MSTPTVALEHIRRERAATVLQYLSACIGLSRGIHLNDLVAKTMICGREVRKAIETLERLIVLAPRESSHFSQLQGLRSICRQTGELKKLLERVKAQELDHTREWEMVRKWILNN